MAGICGQEVEALQCLKIQNTQLQLLSLRAQTIAHELRRNRLLQKSRPGETTAAVLQQFSEPLQGGGSTGKAMGEPAAKFAPNLRHLLPKEVCRIGIV